MNSGDEQQQYVYSYPRTSRENTGSWPHSGTSSWVKEHSDAPPPPEVVENGEDGVVDDMNGVHEVDDEAARRETRRARRREARYAEAGANAEEAEEDRRRRRRREERERERERERRMGASDGSGEGRRDSKRNSALFGGPDTTPRSSWWKRLTGGG
jgi:hypothetical protein